MQRFTKASVLFFILLLISCSVFLLQPKQILPSVSYWNFQSLLPGTLWPTEPLLVHSNRQRWSRLKDTFPGMDIGLLWTRRQNSYSRRKTLIYACKSFCGGFGDRMLGIMTSYVLALITDRHFMIDMTHPLDVVEFLRPNLYNWTFVKPKNSTPRSSISVSAIDFPYEFLSNMHSRPFQREWIKYDDITLFTNLDLVADILRNPFVQKAPIVAMLAEHLPRVQMNTHRLFPLLFDILFSPTPRIVKTLQPILEPIQNGCTLICLHVRMGSNPSNPLDGEFKDRGSAVNDTLSFLNQSKWMDDSTSRLFVTSDSALAMKKFADRYPNRTLTVPGPILHIDRPASGVNLTEGFIKVIADFYALGECHTSILTPSGYSALANRRRRAPYDRLYKYDPPKRRIERCHDVYTFRGNESQGTVINAKYCRVVSNGSVYDFR